MDSLYILPIPDGLPNERGTGMSPRWTAEGKVVFCLPEKNPGAREAKASELLLLDPCAAPRRRFTLLTDTANRLEGALDLSPDGIMLACEDRKSGDLLIGRLPPTR